MLQYGCTRLEIGLQSVYEDVARDTNRGHTVAAVQKCFELAKDAGFKVVVHMMPRGAADARGWWVGPADTGDFPRGISPAWGSVRRAGVHRADFRVAP